MKEQELRILFQKLIDRSCTPEEEIAVMRLLNDPELEGVKNQLIENAYDTLPETYSMNDAQADMIFANVLQSEQASVVPLRTKPAIFTLRRMIVAGAIVLIVCSAGFAWFFNKTAQNKAIVETPVKSDIKAPAASKARIELAGGRKVLLDSIASGTLAAQGNMQVIKNANGEISYHNGELQSKKGTTPVVYNTLVNPRGSPVVTITLVDGTKVWLNAESSIRYFISNNGNERKVKITGEAYFEVAHDAAKPFFVSKGATSVQVLGTHFNVNAYDDEPVIRVTLLEGLVKIANGSATGLLKPGQQAAISAEIKVINGVHTEQVMAWKNGLFNFEGAELKTLMQQLARWYDIDVKYEGNVGSKRSFHGEITRDLNLSQVIKLLEDVEVKCRIEGKTLIVTP